MIIISDTPKILLTIGLFLTSACVYADSKWVHVGSDWYVDTISKKIEGDIVSISVRPPNSNPSNTYKIEFDCNTQRVLSQGWEKHNPINEDTLVGKMYTTTCAKWYKFW